MVSSSIKTDEVSTALTLLW